MRSVASTETRPCAARTIASILARRRTRLRHAGHRADRLQRGPQDRADLIDDQAEARGPEGGDHDAVARSDGFGGRPRSTRIEISGRSRPRCGMTPRIMASLCGRAVAAAGAGITSCTCSSGSA